MGRCLRYAGSLRRAPAQLPRDLDWRRDRASPTATRRFPLLRRQGEISSYTGKPLPPDLNRATFRAPVSMQPKPRAAKTAPPVVDSPAAPLLEAPAPESGRLITVGAYLGAESRPHRKDDEEVQS